MKWLKASYAQDLNHRHRRGGHVFGGRFYSEVIERDAHLVAAIVYVFLNPVRAGIVDRPERWPWSSYAATVGVVPAPEFLNVGEVLELVHHRPDVARRMLVEAVVETARRDSGVRPVGSDPTTATRGSDPTGLTPSQPPPGSDPTGLTPQV